MAGKKALTTLSLKAPIVWASNRGNIFGKAMTVPRIFTY